MSDSGSTLKQLFANAKKRQSELDDLDPRSDVFKTTLQEAIKTYEESQKSIAALALFSSNETLEDISTHSIQYLAIDYLLAELLLKSYGSDRQQILQKALDLFDSFLNRLDQYDLLSKTDRSLFEQFQDQKEFFSLASSSNMEERRRIKVARFQEEKALKSKLEYLRNKSNQSNLDDETERNLYLAEIALFSSQTFQSLDMVTQENAILSQMRYAEPSKQTAPKPERNGQNEDNYSERLDGPLSKPGLGRSGGPLLSSSGKPLQPFTLTDKRTQLRQGVFRPGHNLPTMSIDEYLEEEKRRGGILEGGGNSDVPTAEPDEDNMAYADAQTMKAREWDEFVEANPKGAGNTLNRG